METSTQLSTGEKKDSEKNDDVSEKVDDISEERLQLLKSRLTIAKAWSKKPHAAWKKWISEYNIDDIQDTDEIRDKVRIGYVFRKTESELPAIFDDQPELFIKGRTQAVRDIEPLIQSTYDYLWDIQRMEDVIENAGVYFEVLGMGFVESPYVTKTKKVKEMVDQPVVDPMTGQPMINPATGQPMMQQVEQVLEVPIIDNPQAEAGDPFKYHFSPETKFAPILTYENCPYYFKEKVMTEEEIEAKFGKEVDANETLKTEDADTDTETNSDSKVVKGDMKRKTTYEYYGCLPEELAKGIIDDKGNEVEWTYDKDYHIYLTNDEELKVEENPYEYKPLFLVGNYGLANKFWKFGDAKHLMPLVQELQMYRSQILQHTRKMANPKPLIEINSAIDEKAFSDPRVGKPVKYTGVAPSYLSPSPLGKEVEVGVQQARIDLEKTSPSFDLSGGGGTSQVKTPKGIQVFSEAADKGVRRKRKKISRLIRELIIFQFKQISQNWKPEDEKTIDVMADGNTESVKVDQSVLDVLGHPQILNKLDIEVESLSINRVQQKQDALNLWDTVKDRPDVFNITEVAKDLMQNGYGKKDADRYLISMKQQQQNTIQQFIAEVGKANPQLGGALAQFMTQPNMQQMNNANNPPIPQVNEPVNNLPQ